MKVESPAIAWGKKRGFKEAFLTVVWNPDVNYVQKAFSPAKITGIIAGNTGVCSVVGEQQELLGNELKKGWVQTNEGNHYAQYKIGL